jgi:alkylhydroperoxidase family enzyme
MDIARFETSAHFSEEEKNVLRLAAALSRTPAEIPVELFQALQSQFSDRQLVELAGTIAWENFRARFNRVFGIEAADFSKGQFCPLPERQQET